MNNVISIIGNVKIKTTPFHKKEDAGYESQRNTIQDRFDFLLASIKSYRFLIPHHVKFYLNITFDDPLFFKSSKRSQLYRALQGFDYYLTFEDGNFSDIMVKFLTLSQTPYHIHFEEDHFCELDDLDYWKLLESELLLYSPNICKASFWLGELKTFGSFKESHTTRAGKIYIHNQELVDSYTAKIWGRWFLGTNNIFERTFALRFFNRVDAQGVKHPIEMPGFRFDFEHSLLVPSREILRYIDDDHGIKNSCCWKNPSKKWKELYIDSSIGKDK